MTLTIEVPEKVVERAEALGIPVNTFVERALDRITSHTIPPGFVALGTSTHTLAEAGAAIRDIAQRHTLGGLSVKGLIEEGRRL